MAMPYSVVVIRFNPQLECVYVDSTVIPKFCISIVFSFSKGHFDSQEKLKTMLMQNFGMTNKEYYGMLWYFLQWSKFASPNK